MTAESEEMTRLFVSRGWAALPTKESLTILGFAGVYISSYAAVGVLILSNSEEVVIHWTDYQEAMIQVRKEDTVGSEKDLYLMLVVPRISANDASQIQEILDDTHVCRKLLLERKERTLAETLYDSPFLGLISPVMETNSLAEELGSQVLPIQLLKDLATRSPRFVLSRALDDEYELT